MKKETLRRLSHAIFALEDSKGHLRWKVTDLVRKSHLSRSLIYRYLGNSKKEILRSALQNFLTDFYGFDDDQETGPMIDSIKLARKRMIQNSEAIVFYQKWRAKDSWLRNELIAAEQKFQSKLKRRFTNCNDRQILGLHTLIHGLVTAPFLSADESEQVCSEFLKISDKS